MYYTIIKRPWPSKKRWMWLIMLLELLALVPNLVLHGIAQPNTWRTTMWQIGYDNGWNSDPRMILYAYANYRPLPTIPLVWNQILTDFNVAITIVSLFSLLIKMVLFIMRVFYPLFALLLHICLVALWTVSVYGQMGPDYADERYPSPMAWYIRKSCDAAGGRHNAVRQCQLAKASFAVTVLMLCVCLAHLGHAIYAMWPTARDKLPPNRRRGKGSGDDDSDDEDEFHQRPGREGGSSDGSGSPVDPKGERWEMTTATGSGGGGGIFPASPRTPVSQAQPFTPRTQAFHQLDRKLPLRNVYA